MVGAGGGDHSHPCPLLILRLEGIFVERRELPGEQTVLEPASSHLAVHSQELAILVRHWFSNFKSPHKQNQHHLGQRKNYIYIFSSYLFNQNWKSGPAIFITSPPDDSYIH